MRPPTLHALLIGIDGYLPNRRAGGVSYPPLSACINDVRAAERFLRSQLEVEAERIQILTAPETGTEGLPPETLPSYENMVGAWRGLAERVGPGDQVFILYSGHGGRASTVRPAVKGYRGLDECLVPYDIGQAGRPVRYLRDVEINLLLSGLAERGAFTTVVLDCCHAGGAARQGVKVRGVEHADRSVLATDSLVAGPEELARGPSRRNRGMRADGGMRADDSFENEPYGYVLFAACRPQELAVEASFGGLPRGALSYWFFRLLEQGGRRPTYRRLYEGILAHIQPRFFCQTPLIEGERDRLLFGSEEGIRPLGMPVAAVEGKPVTRVKLRSGLAQGLSRGGRVVLFAPEHPPGEGRLAAGTVSEAEAITAWVEVGEPEPGARPPVVGDEAVLVAPGELCVRRPVRPQDERGLRLCAALSALGDDSGAFLDRSGEGEDLDGFFVWIDEQGGMQIGDGAAGALTCFPSVLRWGEPGALERFARRLDHLARYRNVLELANEARDSELAEAVRCRLERLPAGYRPGERLERRPFARLPARARVEEWLCLTLSNTTREPLHVTVLDLSPNGVVQQVHPSPLLGAFEVLEHGRPRSIPLRATLPEGFSRGRDVLKVFISRAPQSVRSLELPPFDQPLYVHAALRSRMKSPLEQLLVSLAALAPARRGFCLPAEESDDWWVETMTVEVER